MRNYHHPALATPGRPGLAQHEGRGREIAFVRPGLGPAHQVCVPESIVIPKMMKTHCGACSDKCIRKQGPMLPGLSGPAGLTRELWLLVKFLEARCIGRGGGGGQELSGQGLRNRTSQR